jgi:predicted transposase/invertase (TIGR01784 family)
MTKNFNNLHDKVFRDSFAKLETARSFLKNYLPPDILPLFDLDNLTIHKDSFIDEDLQEHRSDLLYEVPLHGEQSVYVYLLFEHKSYQDPNVALQLFRYINRIWLADEKNGRDLRLVLPMVLYHGQSQWQAGLNLHDVFDIPPQLAPYIPDFRYLLYDLSTYSNEDLRGSVILRITLTLLKYIQSDELRPRLFEMVELLRIVTQQESGLEMYRTWLIYLAYASNKISRKDLITVTQKVLADQAGPVVGSPAWKWIEEGREEGLAIGLKKGTEEGREEGRKTLIAAIERSLAFRFQVERDHYHAELSDLSLPQLETLSEAVFEVDTLDELLPLIFLEESDNADSTPE